jgi:2-polyprenyl-3-methyl-5-hydroxy-6-metoxy-1,4-benzoquinol methylase
MSGFNNPAETWNKRFAGADYIFGTQANTWLTHQASHLPQSGRVLAVADGEGRNSVWLAQQGYEVDAFDIADIGVEKARKLASTSGVSVNFQVSSTEDWSWQPHHYDVVVAIFIQFADPDTRAVLFANMIKTLKPGGILLLQGYTPKQLDYKTGGPPLLSHLYTEDLLREAFKEMEILDLKLYEDVLQEGSQHAGQSALIGMVARKN